MRYIVYLIENVRFNLFYRQFHGADIRAFENCSYKDYKNNKGDK